MARPRPAMLTGRAARRHNTRELERASRSAAKTYDRLRREGKLMKLDLFEEVLDGRGKPFVQNTGATNEDGTLKLDKAGRPETEPLLLRDVIYNALADEQGPPSPPGMPPSPGPPVEAKERRDRWRLQVAVFKVDKGEMWECSEEDKDYILKRACAMLPTPLFGYLDDAFTRAIQADVPPPKPGPADDDADEKEPPSDDQ